MNRFLLPILILIWVLICCWWWNCIRKPHCGVHTYSIEKPIIKSAGKLSDENSKMEK